MPDENHTFQPKCAIARRNVTIDTSTNPWINNCRYHKSEAIRSAVDKGRVVDVVVLDLCSKQEPARGPLNMDDLNDRKYHCLYGSQRSYVQVGLEEVIPLPQ